MALYICSKCNFGSASWIGRCPNCNEWNTFVEREEDEEPAFSASRRIRGGGEKTKKLTLISLNKVKTFQKDRKMTGIYEFDRVLGNGLIPGEVILLTGEPGVGKSTLILQSFHKLNTIYISGEEAIEQVKDRAERLKINLSSFLFSDTLQVEGIVSGINEFKKKPDIIVIDSIQTIYSKLIDSSAGSINQLKGSANALIALAKKTKIPVILIGHITKEGEIAGPKTLEHIVDCVLTFEGEKMSHFRILRASKNRFGATDEIGIFEMKELGLTEVSNPLIFVENESDTVVGKAVVGIMEGKRPLFFEIQTLATPSILPVPRRVVKGVDYNKVLLLLAVIRKHFNLPLDRFDIYVNVVGGVSIKSTAADLGIVASLLSSIKNISLPKKTIYIGEVGLLGEVRKGYYEDKIIKESTRLSFKRIFSSQNISHIKELKRVIAA